MNSKRDEFISLVVYVRNQENAITPFLEFASGYLHKYYHSSEIICVDDCSEDNSNDMIKKNSERLFDINITLVTFNSYVGLNKAMNVGVDLSIGDFVIEMKDCSYDFDEKVMDYMFSKVYEGNDVIFAVNELGRERVDFNRAFYRIYNFFKTGNKKIYPDKFRIVSRRAINKTDRLNCFSPLRILSYLESGFSTENIGYKGTSKVEKELDSCSRNYFKHLGVDILLMYTNFPTFFVNFIIFLFLTVGVMYMALFRDMSVNIYEAIMIGGLFGLGLLCISNSISIRQKRILFQQKMNEESFIYYKFEKLGK